MLASTRLPSASPALRTLIRRGLRSSAPTSYNFDSLLGSGGGKGPGAGRSIDKWPMSKANTILNIVPQGERHVVERLGKMHDCHESGFFFAIPWIDKVSYIIDMRERAIDITPQAAITKDNVSVDVSGNVYVQFVDPVKAAYGAFNPLYSVRQHAQSAMRAAIGEMELDEILHGRARLNNLIKGAVQEAAVSWGIEVKRYEITEIRPDRYISEAMDKQAAAERNRREKVLEAEGEKSKATLESEGVKIKLQNESEGELISAKNKAEAERIKSILEAEGQAQALLLLARARAESLTVVAAALQTTSGADAAKLALATDYVKMYGEMGGKSNTIFFNEKPGDINALLAMASMAIGVGGKEAAVVAAAAGPTTSGKETAGSNGGGSGTNA